MKTAIVYYTKPTQCRSIRQDRRCFGYLSFKILQVHIRVRADAPSGGGKKVFLLCQMNIVKGSVTEFAFTVIELLLFLMKRCLTIWFREAEDSFLFNVRN